MVSERQKIEAPPTPAAESYMPPPPSYDEVNDMFASTSADQSVSSVDFFLGEVGIVLHKNIMPNVHEVGDIWDSC
jgi:hypothetical protein